MGREVEWSWPRYDEFLRLAILTEDERRVMDLHVFGKNKARPNPMQNWQIAQELCCSESTVDAILRKIKSKYDNVQPFSEILPPRKRRRAPVA